MFLIIGLGNPTEKYAHTRHNAGFEVIEVLSKRHDIKVNRAEHKALVGKGVIEGQKVMLVMPQTYMNNSGEAAIELSNYYGVEPEEVIVISDDVTLDCGQLRVRKKGSAGGHNGLKSIIEWLDSQNFPRVRVGVGKLAPGHDLIAHVLGHYSSEDQKLMEAAYDRAADAIECILTSDVEAAMNKFNAKV